MIPCDSCGEMLLEGSRICPFCGARQIAVPAETTEKKPASGTDAETAEAPEADDGWRPFRYERMARTGRRQGRSSRVDAPALRVLAAWLAAVIVIAAGVFWYVWTGNDAPAQPTLTMAAVYQSEASSANPAGLTPDFS